MSVTPAVCRPVRRLLAARAALAAMVVLVVLAVAIIGCTPAPTSTPSLGPVATASIEAPASGSPAP
jgi:hypothetical protein